MADQGRATLGQDPNEELRQQINAHEREVEHLIGEKENEDNFLPHKKRGLTQPPVGIFAAYDPELSIKSSITKSRRADDGHAAQKALYGWGDSLGGRLPSGSQKTLPSSHSSNNHWSHTALPTSNVAPPPLKHTSVSFLFGQSTADQLKALKPKSFGKEAAREALRAVGVVLKGDRFEAFWNLCLDEAYSRGEEGFGVTKAALIDSFQKFTS